MCRLVDGLCSPEARMKLSDAITAYLGEPFSDDTKRRLKRCLAKFLAFVGDVPVASIAIDRILAFKQTFPEKSIQRDYLRVVRSLFKFLERNFDLGTLRADRIALPKVYGGSWGCFSHEEIAKLRAAIQAEPRPKTRLRDAAMFEVMYSTGLRRAELAALTPADLDREKRVFHVRGKFDKPRLAYLTQNALDALDAYVAFVGGIPDTERLFPITTNAVHERFKAWGTRAGIPHCHPHMLRKSFATHMWQQGADIYQVSRLARHESVETTQRYVIVTEEEDRKAHALYTGQHTRFTFEETRGGTTLIRAEVFCAEGVSPEKAKAAMQEAVDKLLA